MLVLAIERRGALPRASEINRHYNDIAVPSFILPGAPTFTICEPWMASFEFAGRSFEFVFVAFDANLDIHVDNIERGPVAVRQQFLSRQLAKTPLDSSQTARWFAIKAKLYLSRSGIPLGIHELKQLKQGPHTFVAGAALCDRPSRC